MAKKITNNMLQHLIFKYFKFHPQQQKAFDLIGTGAYIFYGGARGGGKSHLSLAAAVFVSLVYPQIRVIITRASHDELYNNFITKLLDDYPEEVFGYKYKVKERVAEWHNGSRIFFRSLESEADARKIKGIEYQLMIVDEANELPVALFKRLFGSLRSAKPEINLAFKPTILATGNPGGISDSYFKEHWIEPNYDRWTQTELEAKDRYQFIPAKVHDNPSVNLEEYISSLGQVGGDLIKAWLDGDWNVFEGQFFDEWNEEKHVVEAFPIPPHWRRWCGMDLGYTTKHPTVCLWMAQNPETLEVFVYREYAGSGAVSEHASVISDIFQTEADFYRNEPSYSPPIIYADPAMFNNSTKKNSYDDNDASFFIRNSIAMIPANNARIEGWRVVKNWLHWSDSRNNLLYIFSNCHHTIETLPQLRYVKGNGADRSKKEDCDTKMADDAADALRYALVSGVQFPTRYEIEENIEAYHSVEAQLREASEANQYSLSHERGGLPKETNYDIRSSFRASSTFI